MRARRCRAFVVALGAVMAITCARRHAPPLPPPPPLPGEPAAPRPTGLGWLVGNTAEPFGFGLYSYLLFGSPPSDATRPLYVAVVKASLVKIVPIEKEIGAGFPKAQLNLYSILLYADSPSGMNNDDLSKWVVDHYNYARAARMLNVVPAGERGAGVYILSVLSKPLDVSHPLNQPHLWQDLTHVEPAIVVAWIQFFVDQSAKEKPWDESMGAQLALDLRNAIEQAAKAVHAAVPGLATAISWFKPPA